MSGEYKYERVGDKIWSSYHEPLKGDIDGEVSINAHSNINDSIHFFTIQFFKDCMGLSYNRTFVRGEFDKIPKKWKHIYEEMNNQAKIKSKEL